MQLPHVDLPLTQRNAQLVIAREYGYAGWQDLTAEVSKRLGNGLEWAAAQARRVIHDNDVERLKQLLAEYPALLSWQGDDDHSGLLGFATGAYGDAFDPDREQSVHPGGVRRAADRRRRGRDAIGVRGSHRVARQGTAAAVSSVRACFRARSSFFRRLAISTLFAPLWTMRTGTIWRPSMKRSYAPAASSTKPSRHSCWSDPSRSIPTSARTSMEAWAASPSSSTSSKRDRWTSRTRQRSDRGRRLSWVRSGAQSTRATWTTFVRGLRREPWLLGEAYVWFQVRLIENAALNDREAFIVALLDLDPALLRRQPPPPSQAIEFALTYANTHLIPLLTRIWPLPDDLPHAAGMGNLSRVKHWFDESGAPALGDLDNHYPYNDARARGHLHWDPPTAQQVLDMALAFSVINRHFDVADFLLEHGADINTTWNSHEPASILHHLVFEDNYDSMRFLIDRGIDMTIKDYRWNSTARGWALYGKKDQKMAQWLEDAERRREQGAR